MKMKYLFFQLERESGENENNVFRPFTSGMKGRGSRGSENDWNFKGSVLTESAWRGRDWRESECTSSRKGGGSRSGSSARGKSCGGSRSSCATNRSGARP